MRQYFPNTLHIKRPCNPPGRLDNRRKLGRKKGLKGESTDCWQFVEITGCSIFLSHCQNPRWGGAYTALVNCNKKKGSLKDCEKSFSSEVICQYIFFDIFISSYLYIYYFTHYMYITYCRFYTRSDLKITSPVHCS